MLGNFNECVVCRTIEDIYITDKAKTNDEEKSMQSRYSQLDLQGAYTL
jgi:hypothetical protein